MLACVFFVPYAATTEAGNSLALTIFLWHNRTNFQGREECQMSNIVDQVSLGAIVQVRDRLLEQQAHGRKILRLESGDPSFNIPKSRLDIVAGVSGRDKLISVIDMDAETVHKRILAHLD